MYFCLIKKTKKKKCVMKTRDKNLLNKTQVKIQNGLKGKLYKFQRLSHH